VRGRWCQHPSRRQVSPKVASVGFENAGLWPAAVERCWLLGSYRVPVRSEREAVLARLAGVIDDRDFAHPCRVAVDGVTASGKTTLADQLSTHVERLGRPVIRLSMDGFHHPQARRYKQGRTSAIG
jgi:hypothetical protein